MVTLADLGSLNSFRKKKKKEYQVSVDLGHSFWFIYLLLNQPVFLGKMWYCIDCVRDIVVPASGIVEIYFSYIFQIFYNDYMILLWPENEEIIFLN